MREIKFRGVRIEDGVKVYGYYAIIAGDHCIFDDKNYHEVRPESVKIMVGYDDNGKEIYEGDTVTRAGKEFKCKVAFLTEGENLYQEMEMGSIVKFKLKK